MYKGNNLYEVQQILLTQMKRLDTSKAKSEIELEVSRSGALSQNAQAYLKTMSIFLRVKDISKNNEDLEHKIYNEIGASNEIQKK